MGIIRFEPLKGFDTLARRMNDFITEFDKGINMEYGAFSPKIDITEDEKSLNLTAELPGVNKDDVKVTLNDDNILVIKGKKLQEKMDEESSKTRSYLRVERSYGEFNRSFQLPDNLENETIDAKYEDGILRIAINKKEPVKPQEISVEIK